jgi:hypothetical protein
MPFDSPDVPLSKLLDDVSCGKVQLPDFQRPWKWDTDRIASLLASIAQDHPVGVVMMLEVGGTGIRFKPRLVSGVPADHQSPPDRLLLDGQQRLTSLFQALGSGEPVDTYDEASKKRLKRWYYVDIATALDSERDIEDAILQVPEDKIIRTNFGRDVVADYTTAEDECAADVFPLSIIFDMPKVFGWANTYLGSSPHRDGASARWDEFYKRVLENFVAYTVPVIILTKETPKAAVCTVFEKVNTGGVVLNVFELMTATFAADDFSLNRDWDERHTKLRKHPVLHNLQNTDFLQAVSLAFTARRRVKSAAAGHTPLPAVSCRRKDILDMRLEDYLEVVDDICHGFEWAAKFLARQKIFASRDVPYRTQLVPLAAIHAAFDGDLEAYEADERVRQWYWSGVLGELYGGAIETRFARDVEEVPAWISGGPTPRTVQDAYFEYSRLLTLKTRNSAAYKGVYALLMKGGCRDWLKNVELDMAAFFNDQIDIHHIFPRKWCADHGIDAARRDCIVNKTALSYDTNRSIGGRPPSDYLATVSNRTGLTGDALDGMLAAHRCDGLAMRADDFESFFRARSEALAQLIAAAMGKEVIGELDRDAAAEYEVEQDDARAELAFSSPSTNAMDSSASAG